MFHVKIYRYVLAMLTLFSCAQSLLAMKEIKDHAIEIKNNFNIWDGDTEDILNSSKSIRVFDAPFLRQMAKADITLPLNKKTIAFCHEDTIEIWDLNNELGQRLSIFYNDNININCLIKLTNTSIAIGDNKGQIKLLDFKNKTQKIFKYSSTKISHLLKLTETTIVAVNDDGIITTWNIEQATCLSATKGKKCTFLERLSDTKIISNNTADKEIIIWDFSTKPTTATIRYLDKQITGLTKITEKTCALGNCEDKTIFEATYIDIFNIYDGNVIQFFNTDYKIPYLLLNLPKHNAFILVNNFKKIMVCDQKNNRDIQTINCSKFLDKNKDSIVSIHFLEEENMITVITKNGFIIDVILHQQCNIKNSKDIHYFSKNIKTSVQQKKFKDLDFKFANYNNVNSLCEKFKETDING